MLSAGKARLDTGAFPASSATMKAFSIRGIDKLGVVMAIVTLAGLWLPFANFRPSRIGQARGVPFLDALPAGIGWAALALFVIALALIVGRTAPRLRLAAAVAALVLLGLLVGLTPDTLIPAGNARPRVGPAAGFWLLTFSFAIILTDALVKLSLRPAQRVIALLIALAVFAAFLLSGHWNGLSIMKEYATNGSDFPANAIRHIVLALASLAGALIVGLPLGILCQRSPGLRGIILPALNMIQTIPSLALFGLMIAPLTFLSKAYPFLGELGIHGTGPSPAMIALFLYALLPVVSNTAIGLDSVPATVVDAARGMGMTARQRLLQVELPLAFPVILTGVRIVLVQNIGLATIAAWIGGGGFGVYVQNGMGATAIDLVLLGAIPTIALAFSAAIILDAIVDTLKGRHA
ncbi:ABC transporter permease [Labrys miyagiensis]|uniref:ABC transporter permease n=2 Tax=Labrys miyagiensis TaxID=346912 RepID=A0ABQ6CWA4_9HYPH|nr:ABC transporter permease [Labrys miyagiensis]